MLTPHEHRVITEFYAVLFQASQFPAGGYVHREQLVRIDRSVTLRCSRFDVMQGTHCQNAAGTRWHNIMSLVELAASVNPLMRTQTCNDNGALSRVGLDDDNVLRVRGSAIATIDPSNLGDDRVTIIESCYASEMILARYYARVLASQLIQQAVVVVTNSNESTPIGAVDATANISGALEDIMSRDLLITSGAGLQTCTNVIRDVARWSITQRAVSVCNFKHEQLVAGPNIDVLWEWQPHHVFEAWMSSH
ncbi:TPA: hypothetical protein N0F65_006857 [Lagenidium giganteum]|uniref:Uncharacterized protein n=1 Tax=Lagenidium giganteum TaxID=4803 RepID=A0AAV2YG40_9STRA|nr:TPA: hypothetical protein N0F65_006857 [Lagenidium giganteum]